MARCGLCRIEGHNQRNCPKAQFGKSTSLGDEDGSGDVDEYDEADAFDDDDDEVRNCSFLNWCNNFLVMLVYLLSNHFGNLY